MSALTGFSMSATTFKASGEIDEAGWRKYMQRAVNAKIGVYLGSGGNGEGHSMSLQELERIYRIGVEECKGKVPVHSNLPEQYTAEATIAHAKVAVAAGIEVVHLYTLEGRHSMRPTDNELVAYFDEVLAVIKHPVAFAVNPSMGYVPKPKVVNDICRKHTQITTIRLSSVPDNYLINVMDLLANRDMIYHVQIPGSLNTLAMGATALFATEGNIIPLTYRRYLDMVEQSNLKEAGRCYADMRRFNELMKKWAAPSGGYARSLKIAMKVLKIPGDDVGIRKPYVMASDEDLKKFTTELLALGIAEIGDQARAAGLQVPK